MDTKRAKRRLATIVAVLALGVVGAPIAHAGTTGAARATGTVTNPCPNQVLEHPFALDPFAYTLVPGGSFESGAPGWTLSNGARVVSGNETFYVRSRTDSHSLYLPSGSSALSPTMCVGLLDPTIRFFAQNKGLILASNLTVSVIYKTALGLTVEHPVLGLAIGGSAWSATLPMPLLADLTGPLSLDGQTTQVRFRFRPIGLAAAYRIDDVYVDPFKYL